MRFAHTLLALVASLTLSLAAQASTPAAAPSATPAPAAAPKTVTSTADHSKFKELQQNFKSGPEVTKACLACHTEASKQLHKTKHWTWEWRNPENNQVLGKKHVVNNFCTATSSNEKFCASCHIGYGMEDAKTFDYTSEANVDCLSCHDTTGNYKKLPGLAGHPTYKDIEFPPGSGRTAKAVNLSKVAQSVGKSSRDTCGACHFYGGGGDAVKHGDLDSSLKKPAKYLDVHMDASGLNFSCSTCHVTKGHDIPGSRYTPTGKAEDTMHMRGKENKGNVASCQSCHSSAPHKENKDRADRLNSHTDKIACQTCHIPQFARAQPTKMSWDWSTAGQRDAKGEHIVRKDAKGHITYESRKGDFVLGQNVKPTYVWFNGQVNYTLKTDKIDTSAEVTRINTLGGSPTDGKSMIWPIKRFGGKQPYDTVNMTLLTPHTAGNDDTGYWKNLEWNKAIESGVQVSGVPYSGKFGFVKTQMDWPITHMVAPKEKALDCVQCHAKDGRLAGLDGIYMPGASANPLVSKLGWGLVLLTLLGVTGHGLMRVVMRGKNNGATK